MYKSIYRDSKRNYVVLFNLFNLVTHQWTFRFFHVLVTVDAHV